MWVHIVAPRVAHAEDTVATLAKTLSSDGSEKQRLAAVLALSQLNDRSAMKPLVAALQDKSNRVRAAASAALGKLGHRATIPALREASEDSDELVRKQASLALIAVAKANNMELPTATPAANLANTRTATRPGFGKNPRALAARPELFIQLATATDDTAGKADAQTRKMHGEALRTAMTQALRSSPLVSFEAADATRLGLASRQLDISVTKLAATTVGAQVEVEAQLRLSISDGKGKILSFVSGGAKLQVAKRLYDPKNLPQLRKDALDSAVQGLRDKLLEHLRRSTQS